jgi:hypothetical protein
MRTRHTGVTLTASVLSVLTIISIQLCNTSAARSQRAAVEAPNTVAGKRLTFSALRAASIATSVASSSDDYLPDVCKQGEYHWQADKLPVKVFIEDGSAVPGYRSTFNNYVREAFDRWSTASGNRISWREVKSSSAADIRVEWTNRVTQRANGTEAGETNAYTQLNRATGRVIIYGAHMQLLTQLPNRGFSDAEMEKTILHETGHALGLQGHSPVPTDIMYYSINDQQATDLTARDEATMAHLYADSDGGPRVAFNKPAR